MTRLRWARWVVAAILLATVAGCTGVPGASDPQVVRTVGLGESPPPSAPAPPTGATQFSIVQGFLDAMRTSPDRLDAARAYLDDEAAQSWTASTVTVVRSPYVIRTEDQETNTVQVSFQAIGTLTADGVYSPATFDGEGVAAEDSARYYLAKNAAGQWRIHTPVPNGLIITDVDFEQLFAPRPVYFLDLAGTRLVPDLRYSALPEPSVETFLLAQLTAGPRADLANAVTRFTPTPTGNQRLSVTPGAPTVVQVPGSAALDDQSRTRLAAQVAFTLRPTSSFQSEIQLRDGTQVIQVPGVGETFDASDFDELAPVDDSDSVTATYVRGGAVVDSDGTALAGKLGSGDYGLSSAVFDSDGGRTLIAGTTAPDPDTGRQRVLVGDAAGLTDIGVPAGPLTPPVWAPIGTRADADEVWVASGSRIFRFVPGVIGARPTTVKVVGPVNLTGTVVSLAFSPEGSRLALVIRDGAATQVWLASVVRNGQDVRLEALVRVTPSAYVVADVGWRTDTRLAAVGTSPRYTAGVYLEVSVDGSRLESASPDQLPGPPRTLAVSPRSSTQWVTVGTGSGSTVWTKSSSSRSWSPPSAGSSQDGSAPSFST